MNKNQKIQIIRAIAIIAVVMIHTCPHGIMQVYVRPFINFAVATFLFLSGYLTDVSSINTKQFYKKRIIRVIIPYIIWTILYAIVDFISNGIDFKKLLISLLTANASGIMYYIFVYIQFVLLTPLLGKLLKKKYWCLGFIISPISLLVKYYWLLTGTIPNNVLATIWDICCLGWFTFYYLGLFLKNSEKQKKYSIRIIIPIYMFTIIIQMLEGYWWYKLGSDDCGSQLKISSLLTSSIFLLMVYWYINNNKYEGKCKLLLLIGNYSFGIYLSHYMIIGLLGRIIPFWKSIPFVINSLIVLFITLLCTIVGKKICGDKLSKYLGLC